MYRWQHEQAATERQAGYFSWLLTDSSHATVIPNATKAPNTCTGGIGVMVSEAKPTTVVSDTLTAHVQVLPRPARSTACRASSRRKGLPTT